MEKFKVGDKVTLSQHDGWDSDERLEIGDVGVVVETDYGAHNQDLYVLWERLYDTWWVMSSACQLTDVNLDNE